MRRRSWASELKYSTRHRYKSNALDNLICIPGHVRHNESGLRDVVLWGIGLYLGNCERPAAAAAEADNRIRSVMVLAQVVLCANKATDRRRAKVVPDRAEPSRSVAMLWWRATWLYYYYYYRLCCLRVSTELKPAGTMDSSRREWTPTSTYHSTPVTRSPIK